MADSLSLWLPKYRAIRENKGSVEDPVDSCPLSYTTRIASAKILIELDMLDNATEVLDGLLEEDDQVVETWQVVVMCTRIRINKMTKSIPLIRYLLGWVNRLRSTGPEGDEGYNENARFYLEKAKSVNASKPTDDEEMVQIRT